ncbi:hypothetical protein BaOVIS_031780 [Babesia ovis]|uniref:AP2/ERF domain-containing protein n=1 Tax=Babesia ovis TaxID=5869 RepID=A0A9W5TCJ4_BABOV|nr:hypothetical protein BaOVIS_031780 [Babesia ovis]
MLAFNTLVHPQPGISEQQEVNNAQHCFKLEQDNAPVWKLSSKPKREGSNQAVFFMYQMKLLNTLGLVKSVCRPWGTLPHGNDFAYHFHKIATTTSMKLLQCYESVFRTIYDRFDAEAADPENAAASLWAKVEDVDYFKIIYRLECMRNNQPFDNSSYNEMLEKTVSNVDMQGELDHTQGVSNFDELPSWTKFNWESKNRQYSLTALDEEVALHSDIDMDIAAAFHVAEQLDDEEFHNSDVIETGINAIDFEDGAKSTQNGESVVQETHKVYNTRSQSEFDKLVMQVVSKQPRNSTVLRSTRQPRTQRTASTESRINTRQRTGSRRTSISKDDGDYITDYVSRPSSSRKKDDEGKRKRKRRGESPQSSNGSSKAHISGRYESSQEDSHVNRNINVVSASVSYDKRQQRFMAQWKTREGTKHSKSFYAKRYASPLLARKHAELYKMYILQHRGKMPQDMEEPTYEQLAAQNFQALDEINITDVTFMDDLE